MKNTPIGPILGLIPAKGGSQRFPRKNISLLGGRSLLDWSVTAARESSVLDKIIVSTEDEGIAAVAKALDADVPFIRPPELAADPAGVVDVALHALDEMERQGQSFRTLVIMLPTCPLRRASDIREAVALFQNKNAKFLMSVSPFDHTPFAALKIDGKGNLYPFFPEYIGRKSQELPEAYRANGAIHVLDVVSFREKKSYYAQPLTAYVMPVEYSIDIDTSNDLQIAEAILSSRKKRNFDTT